MINGEWGLVEAYVELYWSYSGARLGGFGAEKRRFGGLGFIGDTLDILWRHCGARLGMKNPPLRTTGEVGSVSRGFALRW